MHDNNVTLDEAFCGWPDAVQQAARIALRNVKHTTYNIDEDLDADCFLEQMWNAIVNVHRAVQGHSR